MVGVSIYGWTKGNISLYLAPVLSDGTVCGFNDAVNFPYAFYPLPTENLKIKSYCVKSCPIDNDLVNVYPENAFLGYKSIAVGKFCIPADDEVYK